MKKICVLVDPNKEEALNVVEAASKISSSKVEWWVGCTKSSADEMKKTAKEMKRKGLHPTYLFPGKVSHLKALKHVDRLIVPYLIICNNWKLKLANKIGYLLSKFVKNKVVLGYLVSCADSSVGRKVGAKELSHEQIVKKVKEFLKEKNVSGVYLESGSGHKKHVNPRTVKEVKKMLKDKKLYVGGGIKKPEEAKKLLRAGADRVVVGTTLEKKSVKKIIKSIKSFINEC